MKYYTPELEEFFPGFEFEECFEEKWYRRSCWRGDYPKLFDEHTVYETEYRVKYLDEQDIKDLGWSKGKKAYVFPIDHESGYSLEYYKDFESWAIANTGECLFVGKIKNKSELCKLMKQLGI